MYENINKKSSHGLKTSESKLWDFLADALQNISFTPNRNSNVQFNPREDGYYHVAIHVDNFISKG